MRLFLTLLTLTQRGPQCEGGKPLRFGGPREKANTNHRLIRCHRCCRCHWLRRRPPKHSRGSTAGAPARKKRVTPPREQRRGAGASLVPALRRAPRWWHLPWPDAPVPRGPTAAPDQRPGERTSTGGRTPWSGADAATAAGAHCPPRAAEPQVWRQVRVAAASHMAAPEPASLLPALAEPVCGASGCRGLPEPGLQRPWLRSSVGDARGSGRVSVSE